MNDEIIGNILKSNVLYCKENYYPFIKGRIYRCVITNFSIVITIESNCGNHRYFIIDIKDSMNKLLNHFTTVQEHRESIIKDLL